MDNSNLSTYGETRPEYSEIRIYNAGLSAQNIIATVFHELGHMHQYSSDSMYDLNYNARAPIIQESYASYFGWYLGEDYYFDKGYVKPNQNYEINYQWLQSWPQNSLFPTDYSPFFIDLIDNYNQWSTSYPLRVNDNISGVPVSVIEDMTQLLTTFPQYYYYLSGYAGTYFSSEDLNTMFDYYE